MDKIAEPQHHQAMVNSISMHYVEAGSGPAVLFLHGFPECWYSWRHQLAALSNSYRVVAPDMRGYGQTENRGPYDVETLESDVLALIAHLGETQVDLVGHDWGGAVAWSLAIEHPGAVRSLVACNIPHPARFQQGVRKPRQLLRSWYILMFQLPWLPERMLARDDYRWLAKTLIRQCRPGTFTREDIKTYLASWRRTGLGGGINWYRALIRRPPRFPDPLPVIAVPTTIIWGQSDTALGKELVDGTDNYVADLTVHFLPGVSHWVQQEAPGEVNTFIRQHLSRVHAR